MSEEMLENENDLIALIDENGEEELFEHLDFIEIGDDNYLVCIAYVEDPQDDAADVIMFHVDQDENGEDMLNELDNEEEYNSVYALFQERNAEFFEE